MSAPLLRKPANAISIVLLQALDDEPAREERREGGEEDGGARVVHRGKRRAVVWNEDECPDAAEEERDGVGRDRRPVLGEGALEERQNPQLLRR